MAGTSHSGAGIGRGTASYPRRASSRLPGSAEAASVIEVLQQVVGGALDLLVVPLGGAVQARDDTHAVDAAEVTEHEGVASLGLVGRALGETEVPPRVLVPRVRLQVLVLIACTRLHVV